ncbi:4-hydroxythreonine-4-phosphate dehydrogenase PdxA [candidate division WOR-1 bacterium RIFOXYB2_FULL_42_35]|uniref:4-hydroxythreonine-4-phosphate dehydrogenase PdxA n=1 Tax=candidate division WOR-1 bacterium RIFOXYC2_FULL_41_25 TaxID=1802586 RepID=A0A1F4TLT5_UNCSA|nr:MAG: 4-hydroxythreonine-4-phosphate dehydrogenase PdxA [candidate division WOR-1 bacterium RIFOXYA2_FULL_41_14]OGC23722.1 MAG: 4-hydroxythreonine-4-phosphate dehydrogenase PdxA [candidate division WOR-1 bacterium RIFOXYB2_FULL_42_35]OGC33675.1 MAG: 4-hydroxythreonine-4-phosphate dehydrogenase PdxA [candidate division WOR-1 bacterium RIFOXYC2_FULL_41_25]
MHNKPVIGVTMGDPAGIGPEVCAKALISPEVELIANCVVIGDRKAMKEALRVAKIANVEINPINKVSEAKFVRGKINVLDLANVQISKLKPGQVSKAAGKASLEYIEKAICLAKDGKIDAITTGPINKEAINKAGSKFQGHTELLVERTKAKKHAMMFVSDTLWVVLVTKHLPLQEVSKNIDKNKIVDCIKLAHETVLKLRGKKPKIGVAGLNPHAGEAGLFGDEEIKTIAPAVEEAKKMGINVKGPIAPDAIFYLAKVGMFDIVIAMYHDQGLIPLKLLSFNRSVNVTVGLPIIRTSVDHGTGFDIAGKGWAKPQSMIEAIKAATFFAKSK